MAQVFGTGRVAIYDNHKHKGNWYYYLNPGDRFDLGTRQPVGSFGGHPKAANEGQLKTGQ
jgi:hypothetical protein